MCLATVQATMSTTVTRWGSRLKISTPDPERTFLDNREVKAASLTSQKPLAHVVTVKS